LFSARVALYLGETYLEARTVSAFREQLVREILDLTATPPGDAAISAAEALKRAIETPPEVLTEELPFGPQSSSVNTLSAVAEAVERLAPWVTDDQLRKARLVHSVPAHVIDESIKNIVNAALKFGIALSAPLQQWAIEHSIATDRATLLREQLKEFASRTEQAAAELGRERCASNWRRLLKAAESCQLQVEPSIQELAARAEASVKGTAGN
jgi:hypothetical protein